MPIQVTCSSCRSQFNAPDSGAGKKAKCPTCGNIIVIPIPGGHDDVFDAQADPSTGYSLSGGAAGPDDTLKPCPMCGEMIQKAAIKCRYCGEVFDPLLKKSQKSRKSASSDDADLTAGEWVLAIVCSGIGCIMGIIWMIQGKPKGKKMFFVSLIASIAWSGLRAVVEANLKK